MRLRRNLRTDLLITNDAEGIYEADRRLLLVKRKGESWEHVAMKLLAFCVAYRPGLEVEPTLDQRYKPDVARLDRRGRPTHWIECGSVATDKLQRALRANPETTFDVVKSSERRLRRYRRDTRAAIDQLDRVRFLAFDETFLDSFAATLDRHHDITAVVPAGLEAVYLDMDGQPLNGELSVETHRSPPASRRR